MPQGLYNRSKYCRHTGPDLTVNQEPLNAPFLKMPRHREPDSFGHVGKDQEPLDAPFLKKELVFQWIFKREMAQ